MHCRLHPCDVFLLLVISTRVHFFGSHICGYAGVFFHHDKRLSRLNAEDNFAVHSFGI
uniref:Uncharacterized protein n=1 Tax=Arundo donax TaxID=35708 RepID=A0A0A8ZDZ8_ARUDO